MTYCIQRQNMRTMFEQLESLYKIAIEGSLLKCILLSFNEKSDISGFLVF